MIKAVIFDLDGVIIDSEPFHLIAWKKVLGELGIKLNEEEFYSKFVGMTTRDIFKVLLKRHNINRDISQLVKKRLQVVKEVMKGKIAPVKGFNELMELLKRGGIKRAVASSGIREGVTFMLDELGCYDDFDAVVTLDDISNPKPDPEIYLRAAEELGEKPNNCLAIEDSPYGVEAAKRAGMRCIAVTTSYGPEELKMADLIISSLEEIDEAALRSLGGEIMVETTVPHHQKENQKMVEIIKKNLNNTLERTDFGIGKKYEGKVRDNYTLEGERIIVTTDRISCFDHVVGTVPFKGQVLNQLAVFWFNKTKHIIENHLIDNPDPNVMVVKECKPLPVEVVVRGYITGSLWRAYEKGERELYGMRFEDGLRKDQRFPKPIITPSTKAEHGIHDEPISEEEIISKGLVDEGTWKKIEETAIKLFSFGTEFLKKQNLILVDTKYEFGIHEGKLVLMDEIHTPDSSRFWVLNTYEKLFEEGKEQNILDKEYVRQWLIKQGFMGEGTPPPLTQEVRIEAAKRYIKVYEQITGESFQVFEGNIIERVTKNLKEKGYL